MIHLLGMQKLCLTCGRSQIPGYPADSRHHIWTTDPKEWEADPNNCLVAVEVALPLIDGWPSPEQLKVFKELHVGHKVKDDDDDDGPRY